MNYPLEVMVDMVLIWLLAPLAFLLTCFGLGLSISLVTRRMMNSAVVTSAGFMMVVIIGSLMTGSSTIAHLAPWVIALLGASTLIFFALKYRSRIKIDRQATIAGAIAYTAFSLPVAAYGKPGWGGWVQLDDNSSWYAIADRLMNFGNSVPSPIQSTYDRVLEIYMSGNGFNYGGVENGLYSYPLGAYVPLGIMSKITGIDAAWLFQPLLSMCAALAAGLFVVILRNRVSNNYFLIGISSFSVMASLMYSYVMWGGIKEIVILVPLALLSLTLIRAQDEGARKDLYIYAALAVLGFVFIGGKASVGLVGPIVVVAILLKLWAVNRRWFMYLIGVGVLGVVGIALYVRTGNSLGKLLVPEIRDNGNLYGPLNLLQAWGIWPAKDFRLVPAVLPLTYAAIFLTIAFAIVGIYSSIRRRMWVIPSLFLSCGAVVIYSNIWAGVWLTGKALAVASPIFLLTASTGAYELWNRPYRRRREMVGLQRIPMVYSALSLVVIFGVLLSDSMIYRNTWLSPYPQISELQEIGEEFAGQGPTLMTEYSPYGARYFLRNQQTEAASEVRVRTIELRDGTQVPKGAAADIDLFPSASIDYYNLLVLRKSGNASRPPLNYSLAWSGKTYEVWKKNDTELTIVSSFPLGDIFSAGAKPTCDQVSSFLSTRKPGEKIFTVERAPNLMIDFSVGDLPPKWIPIFAPNGGVQRSGPGEFSREFAVDGAGEYNFWMAGAYPGRLRIQIDGIEVFKGNSIFEGNPSLTNPLMKMPLAAGRHILTLIYETPWYLPGSAVNYQMGPIYVSQQSAAETKIEQINPAKASTLCKRNLDWIAIAK